MGKTAGEDRWSAAVGQYDVMMPLVRELAAALENTSQGLKDAVVLAREAVNLNDRYDALLQTVLSKVRGVVAL